MFNLKTRRWILNFFILFSLLVLIYFVFFDSNEQTNDYDYVSIKKTTNDYNVWLIFTKVTKKSALRYKFHNLLENILNISSVPIKFHLIVDNSSRKLAENEISDVVSHSNKPIVYKMYDIDVCAKEIGDIVQVMTPHFSSKPGTYYSDALFYISLGLFRIAKSQSRAVLLDCDLLFKKDIALLFRQFNGFKRTALFGLAPELTPVYRHILHSYKYRHKDTTFGDFYHSKIILANRTHPSGFQGYNSGVVLMDFAKIRRSPEFAGIITNGSVTYLAEKYKFRGHLGDQDFYTLVGYEYPNLIQTLNCGFNRQLCTWWRDHGYKDVFNHYFKCEHPIVVLHGNCNTRIPKD